MYTRFLFREHQLRRAADEVYISVVSCSWLTCNSNSVASAGTGAGGHPQLGFPRLRVEVGTGKSHLAQAIGQASTQQGYRVLYRETHKLLDDLIEP